MYTRYLYRVERPKISLGRGELGDGLGSLGNGVLGKLTREHEADRRLDFPARPANGNT
jgi:hypothetical protein